MLTPAASKNFVPASRSELALFEVPMTEVGVKSAQYLEITPKNSLTNDGPYTFQITPNPQMLQLSKNYLVLEFQILDSNGNPIKETSGTPPVETDYTGPINMIGKAFIKQMVVSLNGNHAFDSGPHYAYRAYFETELTHGWEAKHSFLEAAGYKEESPPVDDAAAKAFKERAKPWRNGNFVQVVAPLHCDLFQQDKWLLPNMNVEITILRNSDKFCLLNYAAGGDYSINIRKMRLYVKAVEVQGSVSLGLERALMSHTAKYPMKRVRVVDCQISQGRTEIPENDLFRGEIPSRIIIGLISSKAHRGNLKKSPFFFQPFGLNEIYITAQGVRYPNVPLRPDYANNNFARTYIHFLDGLSYSQTDAGNCISMEKYAKGWCLYCFNLTPTDDETGNWTLSKKGSVNLNMSFAEPLTESVVAIIYSEYDSLLTIDSYRNCFNDYKP